MPRPARSRTLTAPSLARVSVSFCALLAGNRRVQRVRNARTALDIVGLDRLLDPMEVIWLHRAAHLDRERRAPRAIDIDHQLGLRPQRFAHRRNPRQVFAWIDLAE